MINRQQLIVTDAVPEDLPAMVHIYNSTIPGRMVTADTEPVTVKARENWFREHTPEFRPIWVARDNDGIVGWLSFQSFYGRPAYQKTAEISVYISEHYRRQGLGRLLLQKAIDACPRLGISTLLGFIFGHNIPSLQLFYSHDFSSWGKLPGVAEMDGQERDLVIVGKRVC